jgi:hypothetical protein
MGSDCANIDAAMADRPTATFGVAIVVAALALGGCGGSSTHTTSTPAPGATAAHQRFVAQAVHICEAAGLQEKPLKARKEALRGESGATATTAFASLAQEASAIARGAEQRLAALARPAADAQTIGALVHAYSLEALDAGEIAKAVAKHEGSLGEAASDALAKLVRQNLAAAKRLGMGACFELE